ncbi:hypothetical protein CHLNCDRAFT_140076 [Chlorella variabilis]|uniref:Thioredoxin domain-containing protein n=1 Tax=Chlorella variabilis TaxID=554065 RepID=E1ZRJ2_CHLVA|nr:hypothetical protein CHLNCDRAFT_140076 [Chlorella variabilis]EFN51580.1 hypothetical protein CHLNCDRAFT_140076 [Chlorella variabilis]|eukprot:XP_005843682.1 hypothetical protein CHLNCDRAFT_140076 [Chlorella variabilis]
MERALSHSLASCSSSSLCRPPTSQRPRLLAPVGGLVRAPIRVQAVAGLSRGTADLLGNHSLNAPSEEELNSPVSLVHSPEEFQALMAANKDKMVVLMCKATHCRPCKLFARKYAAAAAQYSDALFTEIYGDETKATRQMMIDMKVRVTPTFAIFRGGEKVHSHGGINETNLHRYISKYLQEGEAGFGTFTEAQLGEPAQA